jgi:riboflavin synthase
VFTGIAVAQGTVRKVRDRDGILELEIEAPKLAREVDVGDPVAVNGVSLTATSTARKRIGVQVPSETQARSTLATLERGSNVNLELPARLSDRLGAHMVQGHVDGTARAIRVEDDDGVKRVWFAADDDILRYLVSKGSVTLDGVSAAIVEVGRTSFQVALIPYTLSATTLGAIAVDDVVNVEVDVVAKYVEKLLDRT